MTALPSPVPHQDTSSGEPARYYLPATAAALVALGLYVLTMAPDLSWANGAIDGAELITASATLGIPHPPGYPTYVVLGKLFSLLPVGTVAFRYNLFSAVCAAGAVGLVVLTAGSLYPRVRSAAAMSAALLFGFAPLVWSQAVVAEVYSLNLLLIAAFLLVWSWRGASISSGLLLGIAITTHLTSVLWLPAFFIAGNRQWRRAGAGLALGLSPLLLLTILAQGESPVVWGRPVDLVGWWWLVSGRLYAANLQPGYDAGRWLNLLRAVALGPVAFLAAGRTVLKATPTIAEAAAASTRPTPRLLAGTGLLYVAFALSYDTPDAAVLLLPVFLVLALLVTPLLQRLGAAAWLLPLVLATLPFGVRDLRSQPPVRALAGEVLQTAPENALLLTPGDRTIFTLLYFQQVEGERPDLRLVDANLFAFDWYRARLRAQYPDVLVPAEDNLAALQRENGGQRPFCVVGLVSPPDAISSMAHASIEAGDGAPYLSCAEEVK